jgi:hypothetical protein
LIKYRFNLVEVMLAIVILSVGMASIFVLFPAGLSNHRSAMAENSIADMAELVISHIRAQAALKGTADDFGGAGDEFSGTPPTDVPGSFEWRTVSSSDPWTVKKVQNGLYFVRQLSGPADDPYVDFAAVVRVYQDDNYEAELFVPVSAAGDALYSDAKHSSDWNLNEDDGASLKELAVGSTVLPLIVEISYPADMPYDERTKAYFRFEIFNEQYKLKQE